MENKISKKEAFSTIHDLIYQMYDVDISREQSDKIYDAVETDSDFTWDTDQRDILLDDLCSLFGLFYGRWPTYGSSEEYKIGFDKALTESKNNFLNLIG